jgi:hypothetical protein
MLKWMISEGYGEARTIERRIKEMQVWLDNPVLMEPDAKDFVNFSSCNIRQGFHIIRVIRTGHNRLFNSTDIYI